MLSKDQKHILYEEGTEAPGSSILNHEKREGDYFCVGCGTKLFESKKNMKAVQVGHLFLKLYLVYLKPKLILRLDLQEPNIIAKNAEVTMVIFLTMDRNQQAKDTVIMDFV